MAKHRRVNCTNPNCNKTKQQKQHIRDDNYKRDHPHCDPSLYKVLCDCNDPDCVRRKAKSLKKAANSNKNSNK